MWTAETAGPWPIWLVEAGLGLQLRRERQTAFLHPWLSGWLVKIVPFDPSLAPAFRDLNRAWIEELFTIEPADLEVLQNPQAAIVDRGGEIFFAVDGHTVVGTVAAIRASGTRVELAKMAVDPGYRGRGTGYLLGGALLDWARAQGAREVFLLTNSSLQGAIRLYQRLGFVQGPMPVENDYARADVYMELVLQRPAPSP